MYVLHVYAIRQSFSLGTLMQIIAHVHVCTYTIDCASAMLLAELPMLG